MPLTVEVGVSLRWLMNIGVGAQRVITHRNLALVRDLGGHLVEEHPVFFRRVGNLDFPCGFQRSEFHPLKRKKSYAESPIKVMTSCLSRLIF